MVSSVALFLLASSCHGILALDGRSALSIRVARPVLSMRTAPAPLLSAADGKASGSTSVPATIANLAKNIVGSGVLALAAGVGAFSGAPVAIVPALALLCLMCALSGYTFSSIARVSAAVGATSYRDAWAKVFGQRSAAFPNAAIVFKTFMGCLAYAIILGDSAGAPRSATQLPLRLPPFPGHSPLSPFRSPSRARLGASRLQVSPPSLSHRPALALCAHGCTLALSCLHRHAATDTPSPQPRWRRLWAPPAPLPRPTCGSASSRPAS
jgi:hypothetical protein